MKHPLMLALVTVGVLGFLANSIMAQDESSSDLELASDDGLTSLSLHELLNLEITSVSKGEQVLRTAPAAITVLRGDEIRRSGVTSFAEALRLVPGIQVARINSDLWAIGARIGSTA